MTNPFPVTQSHTQTRAHIIARLDRIHAWSLSYLFIGVIGTGWLFTYYDIFDINVSFIQTCVQIKPGCTPATALGSLTLPLVLYLVGYVVGALFFSPIGDRIGRRNMLLITMVVTGLGSLYNALAPDYTHFVVARSITAIGIGADLTIVNVYMNEVAPRRGRAKFTALIFIMSALGALAGTWLGLILTTQPASWPTGLPFALAGPGFTAGWRWMYGIGAILALVAIVVRVKLPESPRWLLARGRTDEADRVVYGMEKRASRREPLPEPVPDPQLSVAPPKKVPYAEIATNKRYLRRALVLMATWFTGYITVYAYASGFTGILTGLDYTASTAGIIVAVGTLGFVVSSILMTLFSEHLERRYWLPVNTVITIAGAILMGLGGDNLTVAFIGAGLIFFGFNGWVSPTYALSAESFPTRARSTGVALVDGVGHMGGCIGIAVIAPYLGTISPLVALLSVAAGMVIAAILVQLVPHTRNRKLDEISP